ncbi:MAG TPA: hypothetical protein DDW31_06705 [candidate division Zixibacteria bacterium]|nr:hypothetical protein [candidate division Zixibacteria bacterium]
MRLEARDLAKAFDGEPVLAGVSLSVDKPGIYALVGPNGSGKTTLMRMLALLEKPDAGVISYDGSFTTPGPDGEAGKALRRRMILVHNPAVMLSGSVLYNAGYGLRVRGVPSKKTRARISELLENLSLAGFERREAKTLSAGESQRLALARALAAGPEMIFLDEPTANLDPMSAKLIERTIFELERSGKTVVLASHNLWQVERLAGWIWFLNNGRIELGGPADQVLHRGDQSFWSRFLGRDNVYSGVVARRGDKTYFNIGTMEFEVVSDIEGRAAASLSPSEVILSREPLRSSARNVLRCMVSGVAAEGGLYRVTVDAGMPLVSVITKASWDELGLGEGGEVYAVFKASAVRVWRELNP